MWFSPLFNISTGIGSGKLTQKKLNKYKNSQVFINEFMRNLFDALNRYYIDGLPETCSQRVVLQSLLWYGCVFFFKKSNNILALPGMPDGSGINVYADFGGAFVYGANGFNQRISVYLPGSDKSSFLNKTINSLDNSTPAGVMVRENQFTYPFINQVLYYSEMMADTLRKIETSERNAATPFIISADESVIDTVKAYLNSWDNNEPRIVSSGVFPADRIKVQQINTQLDAISSLCAAYDWWSSHYRELCGVKNMTNIDKKGENLLTDEVNINDQYTLGQSQKLENIIQSGLDDANELFGTDMKLVINASEVDYNDYNPIYDIRRGREQYYQPLPRPDSGGASSNDS